jgi:hypothetical protein
MTSPTPRWRESWRVLAYSVALALAFIGLQRLELAMFSAFGTPQALDLIGAGPARDMARLAVEAEQLASRSSAMAKRPPAGHRSGTFRLGYDIGYASELIGSFVTSDAATRAQVATIGAAHVAAARAQALSLGLGDVDMLPMRNATDFIQLSDRLEDDENGLAARIEARLTPVHRHLYLLGAHVGAEAAKVESSGGKFALAPASLIRRHATLAGVAPALWQPLAADARGETPERVLARHRAALDAIVAGLISSDTEDPPRPSATAPDTPR